MAEEGFQNEVVPLVKPDAADYPGAYDPKDDIKPDLEKPGATPLPLPGAGTPELSSTNDIKNAIRGLAYEQKHGSTEDPWVRAKTQKFNAGMDGLQFERYYNHPSFKKLGFSPFRDNETLYNENSSAIQDAARSWTQFGKVTGLGFKDAAGFGSLTDIGTAKEYEKAMAIGSSSRGGVSGFTTNLFMNSAYTVGIIGETMLEELGLALITGASGMTASGVTGPLMAGRALRATNKIQKSYNVGKNILRTLESLKDANKARGFFKEAVKEGAEITGKFLNPAENSVNFIQGLSKVDEVKNLSDLAKTAHGFAAFYKDVRNIRLAWGESGLEGGMVRNDVSKDLLNAHVEKYGRAPSKEEADEISRIALEAGMSAGWQNIFAIYYSNKIVFENLFKGFKPLAKFTDDTLMEFGKSGKILKKGVAESPYVRLTKDWKGMVQAAKDPLTYGRTALGYFKANISEGLQESTQEVISGAAQDAAMEEWKGTPLKGAYLAAVGDNLQKQITPEGLEVFMSGFLMGGMIQPVTRVPGILTETYEKFKDPTKYKEKRAQQETYVNELVNKLNDLHNNAYSQLEPNLDHLARQDELKKGMNEANEKGRGKEFYDLKDQSHFDNVMMALKYGRIDSMIERLESLKELSPEEIKEEYGIEQEQFLKTLDKTIANTKRIEQRYKDGQENMRNPVNPGQFKEGTLEHYQAVKDAQGWDKAYEEYLFLQESFDRNLERKVSILGEIQDDTQMGNVPTTEFTPLYSIADTQSELKLLSTEISALTGATGDVATKRKKLEKKRKLLKKYADTMESYQKSLTPEEGKPLDKSYIRSGKAKVKRAYKSYAKFLAAENKDHAFDTALDKSFTKMLDYYELDADTLALNDAVNAMLDPDVFARQSERAVESFQLREEQKQNELRESLEEYVKKLNTERLMQLLYDNKDRNGNARKRMFFDPEELEALINPPEGEPGKMPTTFYYGDNETKDTIVEVERNSKDYREAIDIISEFVPNLMNIPISEEDVRDARNMYSSKARAKKKNDKRTYADLAKQFGFDPNADESTVPLVQVLDAIINSKYATKDEQFLAENLKTRASDGEFVKFTKKGTSPGSYSITTQTVIDARYNSSEYRNGGLPIEHVILHEEIHRRTVEELELDPEFRKKIENLYETTKLYFKANVPLKEGEIPYGLASVQEFIAEAMSNNRFQEELAKIEYEGTGVPVWNKFVDAVLAVLKKTFGKTISNSVLNEAMYIITTKIDTRFVSRDTADGKPIPEAGTGEAPAAEGPVRTLSNTKVTKAISPVDLATPEFKALADALVAEYRKVNADLIEDDKAPLDSEYADKDNDEILASSQFENYYKRKHNTAVDNIFDNYNADTGRTLEPLLEPVSPENKGEVIIQRLRDEGYTIAEINAMSVAKAVQLVNDRYTSKAARLAGEAQDVASEEEIRLKLRATAREYFEGAIDSANSEDELKINYAKALDYLRTQRESPNAPTLFDVSEYQAEDLEKIYNDKLKELEESFTFDDVVVGSVIQLKRGGAKMFVTEKTDTKIIGHKPGVVTKTYSVSKNQFKAKVQFVVTAKNINTEGLAEEFTPEDHNTSNATDENINNTDVEANINNDNPPPPNPCG